MSKSIKVFLFSSFFAMFTNSAMAMEESYKIQVCLINLREIVPPIAQQVVGSLDHMFTRGLANGKVDAVFNFEPEDKSKWLKSTAVIGTQDYPHADCEDIFSTNESGEYEKRINAIKDAYKGEATKEYQVLTNNCQNVTRKVLKNLGYTLSQNVMDRLNNQQACIIQ